MRPIQEILNHLPNEFDHHPSQTSKRTIPVLEVIFRFKEQGMMLNE